METDKDPESFRWAFDVIRDKKIDVNSVPNEKLSELMSGMWSTLLSKKRRYEDGLGTLSRLLSVVRESVGTLDERHCLFWKSESAKLSDYLIREKEAIDEMGATYISFSKLAGDAIMKRAKDRWADPVAVAQEMSSKYGR
jgi:hypothetical protein